MNMRAPIVAMLWENWRLTRVEAACRLSIGIVVASAALVLFKDKGAAAAFWVLLFVNCMFWFSISKLNGGRFLDGYKPGFPLHLLYTRPVPTAVLVGVAMAYDAVSCTTVYLLSAAIVGLAFDQPLPLLSVTMYLVTAHLVFTAVQWSTRNRTVQWVGSFAVCLPFFFALSARVDSPPRVEFSLAENALLIVIGLVAITVTAAGVARQRCEEAGSTSPRTMGSNKFMDWLVSQFRLPCPTSSPMRALIWFELKSSGFPLLLIGTALALLVALLFAIGIEVERVRHYAVVSVVFSIPAVLLLAGNAFGIRRKQGRTFTSAFELTQPYDTTQLATIKVLVRAACVLIAVIAVGISIWASSSLVNAWAPWVSPSGKEITTGLLQMRRDVAIEIGALTAFEHVAQAVLIVAGVAVLVAARAAFTALRARYPRRVFVVSSLVLFFNGLLILLYPMKGAWIAASSFDAILGATLWVINTATILAILWLVWQGLAERTLTARYLSAAFVLSAIFGAAWLTILPATGVHFDGLIATNFDGLLLPALLAPLIAVLTPWSLNRIRHT